MNARLTHAILNSNIELATKLYQTAKLFETLKENGEKAITILNEVSELAGYSKEEGKDSINIENIEELMIIQYGYNKTFSNKEETDNERQLKETLGFFFENMVRISPEKIRKEIIKREIAEEIYKRFSLIETTDVKEAFNYFKNRAKRRLLPKEGTKESKGLLEENYIIKNSYMFEKDEVLDAVIRKIKIHKERRTMEQLKNIEKTLLWEAQVKMINDGENTKFFYKIPTKEEESNRNYYPFQKQKLQEHEATTFTKYVEKIKDAFIRENALEWVEIVKEAEDDYDLEELEKTFRMETINLLENALKNIKGGVSLVTSKGIHVIGERYSTNADSLHPTERGRTLKSFQNDPFYVEVSKSEWLKKMSIKTILKNNQENGLSWNSVVFERDITEEHVFVPFGKIAYEFVQSVKKTRRMLDGYAELTDSEKVRIKEIAKKIFIALEGLSERNNEKHRVDGNNWNHQEVKRELEKIYTELEMELPGDKEERTISYYGIAEMIKDKTSLIGYSHSKLQEIDKIFDFYQLSPDDKKLMEYIFEHSEREIMIYAETFLGDLIKEIESFVGTDKIRQSVKVDILRKYF